MFGIKFAADETKISGKIQMFQPICVIPAGYVGNWYIEGVDFIINLLK